MRVETHRALASVAPDAGAGNGPDFPISLFPDFPEVPSA